MFAIPSILAPEGWANCAKEHVTPVRKKQVDGGVHLQKDGEAPVCCRLSRPRGAAVSEHRQGPQIRGVLTGPEHTTGVVMPSC